MAYNLLSRRQTYYCRSGSSTPQSPDIRAWGSAYYEQTDLDKQNNQSKVRLVAGIYLPSSVWVRFQLKAYVYQKVNGAWTQIGSGSHNHSTGTTISSGYTTYITITDKIIPHDVNGEAQFRVSVAISDVWIDVGTAYENASNQSYAYTYDLPKIEEQAYITNVVTTELNQTLIGYGISNTQYVNYLSKKRYAISIDNPNNWGVNYYIAKNGSNLGYSNNNVVDLDFAYFDVATTMVDNVKRPLVIASVQFDNSVIIETYANYNENTIIEYQKPLFTRTSTTTKRNGQLSGKVTLTTSGTYYNGSVGTLNQGGSYKPAIKYKIWKTNDTEPSTYAYTIPSSSITISNGTFSVSNYEIGSDNPSATNYFDYNYSYNVKLQVSDTFKTDEYTANVTQGIAVWTEYKDRVDFRKVTITDTTTRETTTEISTEGIITNKIIAQNIQGGTDTITNSSSGTTITFDTPFNTAPHIALTPITTASGNITIKIIEITPTYFKAFNSTSSSVECSWIAIEN